MIVYERGAGGFLDLFRIHGSAGYKALFPALFSTACLALFWVFWPQSPVLYDRVIIHPYAVAALIGFISYLLTFRLNFAYGRYWESAKMVHQMISKWLDVSMSLAAFHYQQESLYQHIRPPAFGHHPKVRSKDIIGNPRNFQITWEEAQDSIRVVAAAEQSEQLQLQQKRRKKWWKKLRFGRKKFRDNLTTHEGEVKDINSLASKDIGEDKENPIPIPLRFQQQFTLQSQNDPAHNNHPNLNMPKKANLSRKSRVPVPSLFLQELAHLVSLLSAVAMATLRVDNPLAEVPLTEYIPGMNLPPVDPDELDEDVKHEYGADILLWQWIEFCLGWSRTEKRRTLYNAARPFAVLGGVSDCEVKQLYESQGPFAKVALCTMWLQEFISREYLAGSLGQVQSPIVSTIHQLVSDGMIGYNEARKVAYIPFPFPHNQITSFFSVVIIFIFPILNAGYVTNLTFACILNFVTVLCFLGLHETALELEQPMQNAPNDLPLTTFQAQLNEAIGTMYAGYHPDSWWQVAPNNHRRRRSHNLPAFNIDEGYFEDNPAVLSQSKLNVNVINVVTSTGEQKRNEEQASLSEGCSLSDIDSSGVHDATNELGKGGESPTLADADSLSETCTDSQKTA